MMRFALLCFTLLDFALGDDMCTFIVLWSWNIGTMMYFKFSTSPCVNNYSPKLTASHTRAHTHTHAQIHTHTVVGEVIKCLVRSQSNAVHCGVNPVYSLSQAWPASAGSDGPLVPQRGHNLVDLPGLSWFDW